MLRENFRIQNYVFSMISGKGTKMLTAVSTEKRLWVNLIGVSLLFHIFQICYNKRAFITRKIEINIWEINE